MALAVVAASVTRTELSLADLDLVDPGVFTIVPSSLDVGSAGNEVDTVDSKWVDGVIGIGKKKGPVTMSMTVEVDGADQDAVDANLEILVDAFSQLTYDLTISYDGNDNTWTCLAAQRIQPDYSAREYQLFVPVALTFLRQPTPVAGPL